VGLYVPGGGFESSGCLGSGGEVFIVVALRVARHGIHSRASCSTPPQKSLQNLE
jgi:hypothetical protein